MVRKNVHLSCRFLGFVTFEDMLFKERVCAVKMFANMAVLEREPIIFHFSFEDLLERPPLSILSGMEERAVGALLPGPG